MKLTLGVVFKQTYRGKKLHTTTLGVHKKGHANRMKHHFRPTMIVIFLLRLLLSNNVSTRKWPLCRKNSYRIMHCHVWKSDKCLCCRMHLETSSAEPRNTARCLIQSDHLGQYWQALATPGLFRLLSFTFASTWGISSNAMTWTCALPSTCSALELRPFPWKAESPESAVIRAQDNMRSTEMLQFEFINEGLKQTWSEEDWITWDGFLKKTSKQPLEIDNYIKFIAYNQAFQ